MASLDEDKRQHVSLVGEIEQRVDVYAVEDDQRRQVLGKADIQTTYRAKAVLVSAVGESCIGCDGAIWFRAQILARRCVKRLAGRCSNAVGARTQNDGGTPLGF